VWCIQASKTGSITCFEVVRTTFYFIFEDRVHIFILFSESHDRASTNKITLKVREEQQHGHTFETIFLNLPF